VFADHGHEAAKGDRSQSVLGLTDFFADHPGPEAQTEDLHAHSQELGRQKVAQLVKRDEHAQDDDDSENTLHAAIQKGL